MRHHLQNTCRKQAHILLDVKPVKLQIADPGPRGGCVAQSRLDVRLGLQAPPYGDAMGGLRLCPEHPLGRGEDGALSGARGPGTQNEES